MINNILSYVKSPIETPEMLPQSIIDAIASGGSTVTIPRGRWHVPSELRIERSNLTIEGNDAWLVFTPVQGAYKTMGIFSTIEDKVQGTATVVNATDTLTADSAFVATVSPGDIHALRLGVQTQDPQEPEVFLMRTVSSTPTSTTIQYTEAFGVTLQTWADLAAIQADTQESQWAKLGDYSLTANGSGYFPRGYGEDHDIIVVSSPVENVTIQNLNIYVEIAGTGETRSYGVNVLQMFYAISCTCTNLNIVNGMGNILHMRDCLDCGFDGFRIEGDAINNPFSHSVGSHPYKAYALTSWGGEGCYYKNGVLRIKDIVLTGSESGPTDLLYQNITCQTEYDSSSGNISFGQQLSFSGPHRNIQFDNVSLEVTSSGLSHLFSGGGVNDTENDMDLILSSRGSASCPGYVDLRSYNWSGLKVGDTQYGAETPLSVNFDITSASAGIALRIDQVTTGQTGAANPLLPEGLIKDATITFDSSANITSLSSDNANYSVADVIDPSADWAVLEPGETNSTYANRTKLVIYCNAGGVNLTGTITGTYLPKV